MDPKFHVFMIEKLIHDYKDSEYILIYDILRKYSIENSISMKKIYQMLADEKSKYAYNIVGIIDGKEISASNLIYHFKRIMYKIYKKIIFSYKHELSFDEIRFILELIEFDLLSTEYF